MEKLAIIMTLALAMSTAVLANPVFQDRGNEASNALYQKIGGGDCDDADRCLRPGKVALTVQTWTDPDSDGRRNRRPDTPRYRINLDQSGTDPIRSKSRQKT